MAHGWEESAGRLADLLQAACNGTPNLTYQGWIEADLIFVGPDETDTKSRLISIDSPIGKALLGKRDGDEVTLQRPKGPTTVTIVGVRYPP